MHSEPFWGEDYPQMPQLYSYYANMCWHKVSQISENSIVLVIPTALPQILDSHTNIGVVPLREVLQHPEAEEQNLPLKVTERLTYVFSIHLAGLQ